MTSFTIKDLENLSGVKAHTIRIWEQRYSFLKPARTKTNIRYYSNEELRVILNIALLCKCGYKISHIDRMSEDEINRKLLTLTDARAQQERLINEMIRYMVDVDVDRQEALLDKFIMAKGIDKAINYLIFPILERIGILWQTNHINPAQEHVASNIIRQKLIGGIDQVSTSITINKRILLFLPAGELHELGLLYVYYLMKSRGIKVVYIGANVPLPDLVAVINVIKPHQLYTHITSRGGSSKLEKYFDQLVRAAPQVPIVISGPIVHSNFGKNLKQVITKCSLSEVGDYITSI